MIKGKSTSDGAATAAGAVDGGNHLLTIGELGGPYALCRAAPNHFPLSPRKDFLTDQQMAWLHPADNKLAWHGLRPTLERDVLTVCWHTEYMGLAVGELRTAGREADAEVLAHISPAHSSVVNYHGSITVDYERELAQLDERGHRPLRTAAADDPASGL